jgi:hypothetical protein
MCKLCGSGSGWIRIILGSWIRIKVKKWKAGFGSEEGYFGALEGPNLAKSER